MPYAVSVSAWFDRNRGFALGLVNAGAGIGAALAPQYANFLVNEYGWRTGFLGIAAFAGVLPLLGLGLLVRDPPRVSAGRKGHANSRERWFQAPYLRTRHFALIATSILAISVAMFGVMGLMVPLLTDRDVSNSTIAAVLSTAGFASWIGRVVVGYAMDKIFAPYVAAGSFVLALLGVALIAFADSPVPIMVGAALVGFTFGAEGDLVTFLTSRYFSMEHYSRVLGAVWVTWAWGGGIGTYLVGVTYAATQSYDIALTVFAGVLVAASIAVCTLGPYVYPPVRHEARNTALDAQPS
jgi:predicted MFS family arabinose efflux permease